MAWPTNIAPRGANRTPVLIGLSSSDQKTTVPVAVDPATGAILTDVEVTVNSGTTAALLTGQKTATQNSAVQVDAVSNALSNGMILKAPTTNAGNIYVGLVGVTNATGDILEPGESRGYSVNNTNLLYIYSATNSTDKVSWSAT